MQTFLPQQSFTSIPNIMTTGTIHFFQDKQAVAVIQLAHDFSPEYIINNYLLPSVDERQPNGLSSDDKLDFGYLTDLIRLISSVEDPLEIEFLPIEKMKYSSKIIDDEFVFAINYDSGEETVECVFKNEDELTKLNYDQIDWSALSSVPL